MLEGWSSHCVSSTASRTGASSARARTADRNAVAIIRGSIVSPSGTARSNATSSPWRWARGSASNVSSPTSGQHVGDAGERQLGLGGRRTAGQHEKLLGAGAADRLAPDRRLADPGLALQSQSGAARPQLTEERVDLGELGIPADGTERSHDRSD